MQLKYFATTEYRVRDWILTGILALLMGAGAVWNTVSAFGLSWKPENAVSGSVIRGMLSVWNQMADRLGSSDFLIFRRFEEGMSGDGYAAQGTFLTVCAIVIAAVAFFILASRITWLLLLFPVPLILLLAMTSVSPDAIAATFLALTLGLAYGFMKSGNGLRPEYAVLPLIAALITFGAANLIVRNIGNTPPQQIAQVNESLQRAAHQRYGTTALPQGDLTRLDGEKLAEERGSIQEIRDAMITGKNLGETDLTVTMEAPESYYLRGYVGETYGKGKWNHLKSSATYKTRDTFYWLNQKGFDGLSQMMIASGLAGAGTASQEVTVKTAKADRSVLYTPYEITGTWNRIPKGARNVAGAYLATSRLMGSREYSFSAGQNLTDEWTDQASRLFTRNPTPELQNYMLCESHYNTWLYKQYTKVPDALADLFYQELGGTGDLSKDHDPYKSTIEKIRKYLNDNFIYTDSFQAAVTKSSAGDAAGAAGTGAGTADGTDAAGAAAGTDAAGQTGAADPDDVMVQFLKEHKGCDAHFASAATLMFRYFGIPARYVEGYLITPGDVSLGEEEITVSRSRNHAWTEIYIDSYGWVPIEVTPEYRDIMAEADMTKGLEATGFNNEPEETEQNQVAEPEEEETPADYSGILKMLLLIALVAAAAILGLWVLYRLLKIALAAFAWHRAFHDPEPRKGCCAVFGYMMEKGLPISEKAEIIGNYAAYSRETIREGHRTFMLADLKRSKEEFRKNRKRGDAS